MKLLPVIIFFCLLAMPMATALDNVAQRDSDYDIRVTPTFNGSIDSITSNISINDPDGLVIVPFQVMQKNIGSQDFNYTLLAANTSKIGFYDCNVFVFSTLADSEVFSCNFEVNPSGKEYIPQITGPLMFGGILTLMFVSLLLFVLGSKIELFPMKVFLLIMSGIVAIMNIGFVAGSFQEFFSSQSSLSGSFGTLYITFIMLLTAASIFLIIWIVLTGFKLWKVRRGFSVEE